MADCPSCGGMLRYDIPSEKLLCTYCLKKYEPDHLDSMQAAAERGMMGVREFRCPNCGGEMFSTDKDITGVCSYCGSSAVFESRLVEKRKPDLIIPFKKTKEDCKDIYMAHLKKRLFVPKELKDPEYIDGFRGIYMPYWLSEVKQEGDVRFFAQSSHESGDDRITDTFRITGSVNNSYYPLYHDAGSGFSDDISEKLEPYDVTGSDAKPFYTSYLSGFYAEPADMDFKEYSEYFNDIADRQTEAYLSGHATLGTAEIIKDYSSYSRYDNMTKYADAPIRDYGNPFGYKTKQTETLAMLPVWFMSWRRKDRVAYITVNGQTGKVCADLPIDFGQFFKVFALLLLAFFAVFSFFTISVYVMPVLAVWFSGLIIHMAYMEYGTIIERSGEQIVHKTRKKNMTSADMGIIGIVLIILVPLLFIFIEFCAGEEGIMSSHWLLCIYAILGLAYTVVMTVKALTRYGKCAGKGGGLPSFILSTGAAILSTGVVLMDIDQDLVLYGSTCIAFAGIAVTMLGMIFQYNKVATRPIPQFEHQGGDDNA